MLSSWATVELFSLFTKHIFPQIQYCNYRPCMKMSVHCTSANERSPVQGYKHCSSAVQCMFIYAHIFPLNKFLKEHISMKNWRGSDEWITSLFLTSYNQVIIWSSIFYPVFGMIVLQAKKNLGGGGRSWEMMLQFKLKVYMS